MCVHARPSSALLHLGLETWARPAAAPACCVAVVGAVVLAGAVAGVMCFRRQQHKKSYHSTKDSLMQPDLEAASQCRDVGASKDR